MKKILFILIIYSFFLFFGIAFAGGFKGYLVTNDGQTIIVKTFVDFKSGDVFKYRDGSTIVEIPAYKIKKATSISIDVVVVTLKSGETFKLERYRSNYDLLTGTYGAFNYVTINPVTGGALKQWITHRDVKEVGFDEDYGELKECPKCGKTFPPDFIFCPYDRSEMLYIKLR